MIQLPMDILNQFPVRRTNRQKENFRNAVKSYLGSLGYVCREEKGSFGAKNLIIGDPVKAKYLVTAHYDTCARMFLPNFITPCNFWAYLGYQLLVTLIMMALPVVPGVVVGALTTPYTGYLVWYFGFLGVLLTMLYGPANPSNANDNTSGVVTVLEIAKNLPAEHRDKVCFILFDLEEMGLIGSKSYAKSHKNEIAEQLVLNLDCVGDGDEMMMFPTKKLSKCKEKMSLLRKLTHTEGEKSLGLHEKGFSIYPSDQRNFPYGVGIAAFKRKKHIGLYCDRIHTPGDTTLDEKNVNILRDRIIAVITD